MAVGHVASPPRPDLRAYREAQTLPLSDLVKGLVTITGKKLVAYVGKAKDTRAVDRWMQGSQPYREAEPKLRLTYHVARMLNDHEAKRVVQSWLTGINPELDDRVPIRMLREGNPDEVGPEILRAARAFLAGG